jgi:hypothetical protein
VRFVFDDGQAERELELCLDRPDACIADLAGALGLAEPALSVDGRVIPGELALSEAGLVAGARVAPPWHPVREQRAGAAVLRVVGGLAAGQSFQLPPGQAVVGRGGRAQVRIGSADVSREHCLLEVGPAGAVTLTDLRSRNGTDVNGVRVTGPVAVSPEDVICLGGSVLVQVLPATSLPPPLALDPMRGARPGGVLPFSRAPRPGLPPEEPPLRAPAAPRGAARPTYCRAQDSPDTVKLNGAPDAGTEGGTTVAPAGAPASVRRPAAADRGSTKPVPVAVTTTSSGRTGYGAPVWRRREALSGPVFTVHGRPPRRPCRARWRAGSALPCCRGPACAGCA